MTFCLHRRYYTFVAVFVLLFNTGFTQSSPVLGEIGNLVTDEDIDLSITLIGTDQDQDSLIFTVSAVQSEVTHTLVALTDSSSSLTFHLAEDWWGETSVTVSVSDTSGLTDEETFILTVDAVNDKPLVVELSDTTVSEEVDFSRVLSASDVDIVTNGQTLSYTVSSSNPDLVTVDTSNTDNQGGGQLDLDLQLNQNGSALITVIVSDSETPSMSDTTSFTLIVDPVNDAPTISNITDQSTNEGTAKTGIAFTVDEGGGADEDAETLTVTATSSNTTLVPNANIIVNYTDNGSSSASALSPTLDITPVGDFNGTTTITVTVTDNGTGNLTATDTFVLTVDPVNDAPIVVELSDTTVLEDGDFNRPLSSSDVDIATNGQTLSYTVSSSNPDLVTVDTSNTDNQGGGQLDFDLQEDQHGTSVIKVIVIDNDENLPLSDTTTFTLTVDPVNDDPIAEAMSFSIYEEEAYNDTLTGDDGDPMENDDDNQTLIFKLIESNTVGSLVLLDDTLGTFHYAPLQDFSGYEYFTYAVHDSGLGVGDDVLYSATVRVDITINPVNDPPVIEFLSPADSLVYTDISGYGEFNIFARIYDHDSDSLKIWWIDSMNGPPITIASGEYLVNDSLRSAELDTSLYAGLHNMMLHVEDNGEQNSNYEELFDQTRLSADSLTQIKIGFPKLQHLDNQAFLVDEELGHIRSMLPLTIRNGEIGGTLNSQNGLVLMLPNTQNILKWESINGLEFSPIGKLANPSLSSDSTQIHFDVLGSWTSGDSVVIENLRLLGFREIMDPIWIQLSADGGEDYESANAQSLHHLRIGDTQLNVSRHHAFLIDDDPNRILDSIRIWENTVPVITKNVGIKVKIPESLQMEWNPDLQLVWVDADGNQQMNMFANDTILENGRVLSIDVLNDLTAQDTVYVKGPLFKNFAAISDSTSLSLSVVYPEPDATYLWQRFTTNTIRIGDPNIYSIEPHIFIKDLDPAYSDTLAPILIKENRDVSAILACEDILLSLPDTSELAWDLSQASSIIFDESLISSISLDNPHVLRLDVSNDLKPGDSLLIRQLRISNIVSRQAADTLRMSLNRGLSYVRRDTSFMAVGAPSIASIDTQRFLIKDIPQFLTPIQIVEDSAVKTIGSKHGIVLQLVDSFPVFFDSSVTSCSIIIDGVSFEAAVSPVGDSDQKKIHITSSNLAGTGIGDTLLLDGFKVKGFESQYGFANELLLLSVKGESRFTACDISAKAIGDPSFSFEGNKKALSGGLNSIELPVLRLSDDPEVNIIQNQHRITLKIPESVPLRWQQVPFLQVEGAYQNISPVPHYEGEKKLTLEIESDFMGNMVGLRGLRVFVDSFVNGGVIWSGLNDSTYFDTLSGFLHIGEISFVSSDSIDQIFFKTNTDEISRTLNPITIGQGEVAMIDSSDGVILRIPTVLNAHWDPMGIPSFQTSATTTSEAVWFSENFKDMGLNLGNFPLNEEITISGLRFTPFDSSSQGKLQLVLDRENNGMVIRDAYSKVIADPKVFLSESKTFVQGDSGEFATLPDIIIQEDMYVSVLDFANIIVNLPEELAWSGDTLDATFTNQFGSFTELQLTTTGGTLTLPMQVLPIDYQLTAGQWLRISGLHLDLIDQIMNRKPVDIDIEIGPQSIPLFVDTDLSVGFPGVEISPTTIALSSNYNFVLDPIKIIESAVPVYNQNRDALLIIPPILQPILNWVSSDVEISPQVRDVEIFGDTLLVRFKQALAPEDTISIGGLKYSSQLFFESNGHLDDIARSIAQAPLELSYRLNDAIQFEPVTQSADSIDVFPKLFFQDANVTMNGDITEIHIPLYPGLLEHGNAVQQGIGLQLEELSGSSDFPILNRNREYLQDTTRRQFAGSSFTLEDLTFNLYPEDVTLINILFDRANRVDGDMLNSMIVSDPADLNFAPAISDQYRRIASVQSANLDFGYDLNAWVLSPDSAAVSASSLSRLTMTSSDTTFPENLHLRVWNTGIDIADTNIIVENSRLELEQFISGLSEGVYNVELIGIADTNTSFFPVQRQFLYDNSAPNFSFDTNSPVFKNGSATGRNGFGHQVVAQQRFEMNLNDNSFINLDLGKATVDADSSSKRFYLSDIIDIQFELNWGIKGYDEFEDTLISSISPSTLSIEGWTISSRLDSLIFCIVDSSRNDKIEALKSKEIVARLWIKISDQAGNRDSIKTEFTLVLHSDEALSDEVFNYPNPFNPGFNQYTNIRYVLTQEAEEGYVLIMDAGGEIVFHQTLGVENLSIGVHELTWNGTNLYNHQLASGVYFAYIKIADSFKRIKILILN